jgi:hypothetical protein
LMIFSLDSSGGVLFMTTLTARRDNRTHTQTSTNSISFGIIKK